MLNASRVFLPTSRNRLFSSTVRRQPLQQYQGQWRPNAIRYGVALRGIRPIISIPQNLSPQTSSTKSPCYIKSNALTLRHHKASVRFFVDKTPSEGAYAKNKEINSTEKGTSSRVEEITTENGPDMLAGVKSDMNVVKETFALRDVPRQVLYIGIAGLAPYVVTSSTTLFLAYDINNIQTVGRGFMFTEETASALLSILEPVQVGYGAVILSFLGAIHWGLEFAGFGGHTGYRRYILGMMAPVLAWPTVFMPFDYALLTQFLGFTGMYFADAQATTKGWTPRWYTTYRFVLTFIVGASIVVTLVGRGKIGDSVVGFIPRADKRAADLKSSQMMGYEREKNPREYQMALKAAEREEKERSRRIEDEKDTKKEKASKNKRDTVEDDEEEGSEGAPKGDEEHTEEKSKQGEDEQGREKTKGSDGNTTKDKKSGKSNKTDEAKGESTSRKKKSSEKPTSGGEKDSNVASDERAGKSEEKKGNLEEEEDSGSSETEKVSSSGERDDRKENKANKESAKGKKS